jgi:hypothetical protein
MEYNNEKNRIDVIRLFDQFGVRLVFMANGENVDRTESPKGDDLRFGSRRTRAAPRTADPSRKAVLLVSRHA